jgi:sec-independent protein translocase protein TatB
MPDISWIELLFVAVLALLVIGPKDLPALFKAGGKVLAKGQRLYRSVLRSMQQLEQEVARSNDPRSKDPNASAEQGWEHLLPEEVRNLPADFLPGSMTAEQHAERHRLIAQAQQHYAAAQQTTTEKATEGDKV